MSKMGSSGSDGSGENSISSGFDPRDVAGESLARFLAKVDIGNTDECWEWEGYQDPDGYGSISIAGEYSPHRLMARFIYDIDAVDEEIETHHTCNNRACCNPAHLKLVDTDEHYRLHSGARKRLDPDQVREIRERYRDGESQRSISEDFPVQNSMISMIVNGKAYTDVQG